eukprot:8110647-Prorocentrum_lima.AAC.1
MLPLLGRPKQSKAAGQQDASSATANNGQNPLRAGSEQAVSHREAACGVGPKSNPDERRMPSTHS